MTKALLPSAPLDRASLPDDKEVLKDLVLALVEENRKLREEVEKLKHHLFLLANYRFGRRSERVDPRQLRFLPLDLPENVPALPAATPETEKGAEKEDARPPKRKGAHGRRPLPPELPRVEVEHAVPDVERCCGGCSEPMVRIGEAVTEELDFHPGTFFVRRHVRPKFACPHCQEGVITAPRPEAVIERGLPGPGLLAHVLVSKYADHLPLYRQEVIFRRQGIELSRSTLCDWVREAAWFLGALVRYFRGEILKSRKIHTDDIPVPVLEVGRGKTKEGRLWVYHGDPEHPYVVFEYTPDRKRDGPARFLAPYRGYLQADAYAGYDAIYVGDQIIEVACWAHARRKFYEARSTDVVRSRLAIDWIRGLYDVEREARDLACAERRALREERSRPILDGFKSWLDAQAVVVLPKSPMGEAVGYALNQWVALTRYLEDGILHIDNNLAERTVRPIAIGRKNWLFAGSDQGGERAATIYSVMATCKLHGVEPYAYLRDVLERLPAHPANQIALLAPPAWKLAQEAAPSSPSSPAAHLGAAK